MTYSLHMNIQTFAYSTIISPKNSVNRKKILTFAYEHTYIIIVIIYYYNMKKNLYVNRAFVVGAGVGARGAGARPWTGRFG